MANATTIYHTEINSLKNLKGNNEKVPVAKGERQRRLHKALLRYHDPKGWPMIREALRNMGLSKLIGKGKGCLVPEETRDELKQKAKPGGQIAVTKHTGVNPVKAALIKKQQQTGKSSGQASFNLGKARANSKTSKNNSGS
jgi:hypothetical protein